jgi:hypothetical protein
MADSLQVAEMRQRKQSVGTVEMQGPGGVVRTVNLEDMTEADRALAAEFGYKPVFKRESRKCFAFETPIPSMCE